MTTAKEYRQCAEECLAYAKQARTGSEREIFLKLAEGWLLAAKVANRLTATTRGTRPSTPSLH
jgi:hypothetical protein